MKYGCKNKSDILRQLTYMVLRAPDFPPEDEMTMELAWATIEHGLKIIEETDARAAIMEGLQKVRGELAAARELFEKNEIVPACHKLQDVAGILKRLKVKPEVQRTQSAKAR